MWDHFLLLYNFSCSCMMAVIQCIWKKKGKIFLLITKLPLPWWLFFIRIQIILNTNIALGITLMTPWFWQFLFEVNWTSSFWNIVPKILILNNFALRWFCFLLYKHIFSSLIFSLFKILLTSFSLSLKILICFFLYKRSSWVHFKSPSPWNDPKIMCHAICRLNYV